MRRGMVLMALGVVLTGTLWFSAAGATAAVSFSWSAPTLTDDLAPFYTGQGVSRVSCPTTTLCVGVDPVGGIVTSTAPTSGQHRDWKLTMVGSDMLAVSCTTSGSTVLCAAVDSENQVYLSTDPTGGYSAWHMEFISGITHLSDVSCPTTGFCIAITNDGNVVNTRNPTALGSATWSSPLLVASSFGNNAIACPASLAFCEAVIGNSAYETATPASAGWHASTIDSGNTSDLFSSIACPSDTLCVTSGNGTAAISTNPNQGTSATWSTQGLKSGPTGGVGCGTSVCVVPMLGTSDIFTTVNPSAGASANWADINTGSFSGAGAGCTSGGELCVVGGGLSNGGHGGGGVLFATTAFGSSSSWNATPADAWNPFNALDCPSTTRCAAVDRMGNLTTSATPGSGSWTTTNIDGTTSLNAISCPGATTCVGVDDVGQALTGDPAQPGSWSTVSADSGHFLHSVGCTTNPSLLCVAGDEADQLVSSATPGTAGSWQAVAPAGSPNPNVWITGVSCPSTSLCVAVDNQSNVFTSSNPGSATPTWHTQSLVAAGGGGFTGLSCPTSSLCVATDGAGNIAWSTDPADGAAAVWHLVQLTSYLYAVSCTGGATPVCAASSNGAIYVSDDPTGTATAWSSTSTNLADPAQIEPIAGVSCPSTTLCIAADSLGQTLVGTPATTSTTTSSSSSSTTSTSTTTTSSSTSSSSSTTTSAQSSGGQTTSAPAPSSTQTTSISPPSVPSTPLAPGPGTPAASLGSMGGGTQTINPKQSFPSGIQASCLPSSTRPCSVQYGLMLVGTARDLGTAAAARKPRPPVKLGSGRSTLSPGKQLVVSVRLSASGAKLLRQRGSLRVKVLVRVTSPGRAPVSTTRVVLVKLRRTKHG